jgi:predicted small secreted protein
MRRTLVSLAVVLCALTLTTACGGDEGNGGDADTASDSATPQAGEPKVIPVTIEGNNVTPNGERIEIAAGQDVELDVTADAPGEIHVHSTPEQELEYEEGESTLTITGLEQPGTVDVEVHDLEKVVVQLEVH